MPDPIRLTLNRESAAPQRGTHRIFIGMAAGVGKTYRALGSLREHLEVGENALIGVLETHGRQETMQAADGLPMFPRREIQHGNVTLSELDVDGLIQRRPFIVLIDELAHTNAPGSPNVKRWQDVEVLRDAGIHVLSTMNVQHLESLNDTVARLTGVRVRERVPDHVLHDADELVLIDLPPEDLRARLRAGKIYSADKIEQSLGNFFTVPNLTALREIALRHVAQVVEMDVPDGQPAAHEVVVVAIAAEDTAARLIRRGGQLAERLRGELHVVTVRSDRLTQEQSRLLDTYREITAALGGQFAVLEKGEGIGAALVSHARRVHATQIVMGETSRSRWAELWRGDIIKYVLRQTRGVDVHVISRD
ncbi:universal stress protein [Deinococcus fonticola]|uniref:universal stress protein n=1 Tax=Deinococcus fonticola TaxID=2528713 RepID=UPI001074A215|nr:universal stress protein [Deinococcus fonticola]